ncbi:MAG: M23 family metallopeptidase [Leptolyngbyaceae bacterium]|nr:M23 family metallopeptidase [Leptolyngbyaceae bacterium]
MVNRWGRGLVLMCVAALVSCMFHSQIGPQFESHRHGSPSLTPSDLQALNASTTFLLQFPSHWVSGGKCQVKGTQTMLVTKRGDRLDGRLSWIWNNKNDAAILSGSLTPQSVDMTLVPPSIGGFGLTFKGSPAPSTTPQLPSFSGRVEAQDTCRNQDGAFTLTPVQPGVPNPQSAQLPFFRKPFELDYLITNYFDHQVPRQFQDNNGYFVTWTGQQLSLGSPGASIDGHAGYDWATPEGTPLLAVADGVVYAAGESETFFCPPLNRDTSGLEVYLEHTAPNGDRFGSEYVHLSRVDVVPGQAVKKGQVIGISGNTGCSTGPHLHFGVYRISNNQRWTIIDPYGWNGSRQDPWSRDANGAPSVWLWEAGHAPILYEYGR